MKMLKILAVCAALVSAAYAQDNASGTNVLPTKVRSKKVRPPYEHRGFFFSMGYGTSYADLSFLEKNKEYRVEPDYGSNLTVGSGARLKETEYTRDYGLRREFSGWSVPNFDFRFGKSIANLVALYTQFGIGQYMGSGKYFKTDREQKIQTGVDGTEDLVYSSEYVKTRKEGDAIGMIASFGLGFSVYPFRNPSSVLNGFYVGVSGGIETCSFYLDGGYSIIDAGGIFTRYEIGKDWWVSETWSLGVGFGYTDMVGSLDDGDNELGVISFFVRLTHG